MKNKPKILFVGDMPGWAFDQIITFVRTNISDYDFYYDFTVYNPRKDKMVNSDIKPSELNWAKSIHPSRTIPFQHIPILRGIIYRIFQIMNKMGKIDYDANGKKRRIRNDNSYDCVVYLDYYMDKDADFRHVKATKTIRGIYTASFPPKGIEINETYSIQKFCEKYLVADAILVGAPSIASIYQEYTNTPITFANLAYNESIFKRRQGNRNHKRFTFGWTGNPNREFKGFYSIIEPVIEELKQEGHAIELKTQFEGKLNSLADFWQTIDCAIITSDADAGPSLFMEASLCGVPSISTAVGMPKYVIDHKKNGIFIDRSKKALRDAILEVISNKLLMDNMRSSIRDSYIKKLGTDIQIKNWTTLFQEVIHEG